MIFTLDIPLCLYDNAILLSYFFLVYIYVCLHHFDYDPFIPSVSLLIQFYIYVISIITNICCIYRFTSFFLKCLRNECIKKKRISIILLYIIFIVGHNGSVLYLLSHIPSYMKDIIFNLGECDDIYQKIGS